MLLNTAQLVILFFGHRPQEQVETRLFFLQRKNFCRAVTGASTRGRTVTSDLDRGSGKTQQVFTKAHSGLRPGDERRRTITLGRYTRLKSAENKFACSDFTTHSKTSYRVYHIEMDETKWLWGREKFIILLNYGAQWLWEIWTFEFQPPVFKKLT